MLKKASAKLQAPSHLVDSDIHLKRTVARRAYELFEQRGGGHGHDLDDWLHAERDMASRTVAPRTGARLVNGV